MCTGISRFKGIVLFLVGLTAGPLWADINFEDKSSTEIKRLLTINLVFCRRDVQEAGLSVQPDLAVQQALATCLTRIEYYMDQVGQTRAILPVCRAYTQAWETHRREIEARLTRLRDLAPTLTPQQTQEQLGVLMRFVDDGFHPPGRFDCS